MKKTWNKPSIQALFETKGNKLQSFNAAETIRIHGDGGGSSMNRIFLANSNVIHEGVSNTLTDVKHQGIIITDIEVYIKNSSVVYNTTGSGGPS